MTQRQDSNGRDSESRRRPGGEDEQYRRRAARGEEGESWMHDKERQAARTGYADYAYDPARGRGREYGHASADDHGRGGEYAREYGAGADAGEGGRGYGESDARSGSRMPRDYGRGWREDGAPRERGQHEAYAREPGERGLYGAHGPGVRPADPRGDAHYDSGWRARGFDERSQSVGWEDDRGDAPGGSSPRQGDPRHGYYVYGGERERRHDYDEFDPRRGRHDDYRPGRRRMGEGYGESSGYAGGEFAGSGYGAGFEPNREWSRERAFDAQSAYREQGMPSHRGRGPRNYARPDPRIEEELNERLTEDALVDASDIEVSCSQGKVVLSGEVDDRWMKHRAEDIADACGGVKDVDNRLRVRGRESATLAADPHRGGRGENAGRFGPTPAAKTPAGPASVAQGSGGGAGGNAGAGSSPGTGAGTSGAAPAGGGSSTPQH
ncbi:BON domain-containing protein [Lysobacter yananisis]|uniref:BON domain-containing protein n=1 Tax=Lysobacter yananisis TaxID=1003114 RepID=A0ABY9PF77_9GAMM|nr:BON domain-containing protein [Lysobacter yananisis]WMT05706.1 BON domain-containing protein [Lysobacter yananisis]